MDRSPVDIEALVRIANDLFRGDASTAALPLAGPSAAQAAAAAIELQPDASALRGLSLPVGGATSAPNAPANRPALGRPLSPELPAIGYGTRQPYPGIAPPPGQSPPGDFNPYVLDSFDPIPHVDEGLNFGMGRLPSIGFDDLAGRSDLDLNAFGVGPTERSESLRPAGAAPSPATPLFRESSFPASSLSGGSAALPRSVEAVRPVLGSQASFPPAGADLQFVPQSVGDLSGAERAASHVLAPSPVPGLPPNLQTYVGAPISGVRGATVRNIDRPTPTAFEFTDEPHLGDFAEAAILRASLDTQRGAPAVEGLHDRNHPLPEPMSDAGRLAPSPQPSFYFLDDRIDFFADAVPRVPHSHNGSFSVEAIRRDFPVLHQKVRGYPLVWLDNGATTQKPRSVIERVAAFYANENSNISRSAHTLAFNATNAYEDARETVRRFINASSTTEIVFVRGTTEAINLVAQSFGRRFIGEGDEIVLTHGEHHANIVPWYNLAKEVGAKLKVVPFDENGEIMLDAYEELLTERVKIVATTHVANALGTVIPVKAMVDAAHRQGIPVLVDGAQSISHMPVDVQDIGCDFFVFSGHKVFAPTGIGALYGRKDLLDQMPPWQGGGNMIRDVTFEHITFQEPPGRFEAGTGNIADAIGLAEALKYIERLGMTNIQAYEHALLDYATEKLAHIDGLRIIGRAKEKAGVISLLIAGKEPVEVGKALDERGIAVRAGHHCALPILRRYGVEATVRPAFAMYNTFEEADRLASALREIATR